MAEISSYLSKYFNLFKESLDEAFSLTHIAMMLGLVALAIGIDLLASGWNKSCLRRIIVFDKSTRTDFFAWLIESLNLFKFLSLTFSFAACYYLVGLIQKNANISFHISNPEIQFAVVFLVSDFKGWFSHFVFHKSNSLWQLHAFHHSATNFNALTLYRGHFLEAEIRRFFDVLPFVLFGAPILTFVLFNVLRQLHQLLVHSTIESDWGFIGKYILVSPAAHRLHHSINPKHFNKNFGITFIFWDRLFGTYHPGEKNIELGIPDNPYNKGYFRDMLLGQWLFVKSIFRSITNVFRNKTSEEGY